MGSKQCGVVIAPHVDDADGDEDLGVDDALLGEMLHHAPCGEFVVVGVHELARDGLEGVDEAGEVSELVKRFRLGKGDRRGVVALAQLDERGGRDGAFEMEMKFGLGEAADERLDIVHRSSVGEFRGRSAHSWRDKARSTFGRGLRDCDSQTRIGRKHLLLCLCSDNHASDL